MLQRVALGIVLVVAFGLIGELLIDGHETLIIVGAAAAAGFIVQLDFRRIRSRRAD